MTLGLEQIPLHSLEAEAATIGFGLWGKGSALRYLVNHVRPEMFYLGAHQTLFRHVAKLAASGPVEILKLKHSLITAGVFDEVGGEEKLIEIAERGSSVGSIEIVSGVVRDNWAMRRLLEVGRKIEKTVFDCELEIAERAAAAKALLRDSVFQTGGQMSDLADIDLAEAHETGVKTGFHALDAQTGYGMPRGQTIVIEAYHKGGKTAMLVGLALFAMQSGLNVVYATLADLDAVQLKRRILKQLCGMSRPPEQQVIDPQPGEDWNEALSWLDDRLKDGGCQVYQGKEFGRHVEDLAAKCLERHSQVPIDLLVVDYVQKLHSRQKGAKDNKTAEMEYVSDALKCLAEDLNCPVPVGSQITQDTKNGAQMSKYARGIEEDAGMVIQIGKIENPREPGPVEITCAYNRFGPSGECFELQFDPSRVRFWEVRK